MSEERSGQAPGREANSRRSFIRNSLIILGGALFVDQQLSAALLKGASATATSNDSILADQINATTNEVSSWDNLVDIGVVLHKSEMTDFDNWISDGARHGNWKDVLYVKRSSELAGYSSETVDENVKLTLSNFPMFREFALPKTDVQGHGYFSPSERYVLHGYRYAMETGHEARRWGRLSGFTALREARDRSGKAFYRCNPDRGEADNLPMGTRWHEAGNLMDCFFIFGQLGIDEAARYATQEWRWLNSHLWSSGHFDYAVLWPGFEFSAGDVFPHAAKLQVTGGNLENWDRISKDIWNRYLRSRWSSPQWSQTYWVIQHESSNPERRLDGTLSTWALLNLFFNRLDGQSRANLRDMVGESDGGPAWAGLRDSDLREPNSNRYRSTSTSDYSDTGTAQAALCLFLLGISPQDGGGLAIPLISNRHLCISKLNFRYFEFDYEARTIKIPVWGGTTLGFGYGSELAAYRFSRTGIYRVSFAADWNSVRSVDWLSDLYPNELYLTPLPRN